MCLAVFCGVLRVFASGLWWFASVFFTTVFCGVLRMFCNVSHWAFSPNLGISERYERCSTPRRLPSSSYATHMPCPRTGVKTPSQKYSGVWLRDPKGKKYRGGADPPKGFFSALGAAWRPPSATPMRSPTPQPPYVPLPVEPASKAAIPPS